MFTLSFLAKPKVLVGMAILATGIFSGCNFWDPIAPGAHIGAQKIGNTTFAYVEPSQDLGQLAVTFNNTTSTWIVNTGTGCNWVASCMVTKAQGITSEAGFLQAMADCEVSPAGEVCGQWIYRAAEVFVFGGDGPAYNCMLIRIDLAGNYEGGNGDLGIPGSWGTVWPYNPIGYNGDGEGAVCIQ